MPLGPPGCRPPSSRVNCASSFDFQGVTITDSLGAGALQAFGTFQHRALLAAGAGMDLILCASRDVTQGEQAMDGLETGYANGTLSRSAFKASLQRVIDLRSSLGD